MTEIKAIILSMDLWKWLYENPLKRKQDYPKFEEIHKFICNCPCCSYYSCEKGCPLFYPNNGCGQGHYLTWCLAVVNNTGNIFNIFNWKRKKEARISAKFIYKILEEKYKELLNNDNKI